MFRDTTDLSVSPELWADIQRALERSAWFVLLASPAAAESKWVHKEIDWWLEKRSATQILPVLVEGTLSWNSDTNRFHPTSTAMPRRLRDVYTEEPLWLDLSDLRSEGGEYSPAAMERGVASLAARLRGVDLDTVLGEHIRIRRRTRRVVVAVLATLAVLAGVAATGWVTASAQRDQANRAADIAASRNLVLESERLRSGQIDRALRLGIAADHLDDSPRARSNLVAAMAGGRYAGTLPDSSSVVLESKFAPSGRLAVIARRSGSAQIWDLADPAHAVLVSTLTPGTGSVQAVAFRPDGRGLALGGDDGTVTLWDVSDPSRPNEVARLARLRTGVEAMAFDGAGGLLYVGSNNMRVDTDNGVQVWDVHEPSRPVLSVAIPTTSFVQQITVLPRMNVVAIAGTSGVELWSTDARTALGRIDAHADTVYGAAATPDGDVLATCSGDRTVLIWDISHLPVPRQIARLPDFANSALACAFSRDGGVLAVGVGDGTVEIWNMSTPARPVLIAQLPGHSDLVDSVDYAADGLLISGSGDGRALAWAATVPTHASRTTVLEAGTGPVTKIEVRPSGTAAVNVQTSPSGSDANQNRTTRLYRWPTAVADLEPADVATTQWLSPNGRMLAVADTPGATSGGVSLWDVTDPQRPVRTGTANVPGLGPDVVAWSSDGTRMLLSGQLDRRDDSGGAATLWDVSHPYNPVRLTARGLGEQAISAAAMTADGRFLALAAYNGIVTRWDVSNPSAPRAVPDPAASHPAVVRAMKFDPVAEVLATASNDQTVALWSPTGRRLAVLDGPTDAIGDIAFSADGSLLAVLDDGGGVTLWDVVDAALPVRVDSLPVDGPNRAEAIAWSTDGGELYVGRFTATLEIWDVRPLRAVIANPRRAACALTGRGLDAGEWAAAVPERAYRTTC